jgi:hypothetical protein
MSSLKTLHFAQQCQPPTVAETFTEDNGWISSVIGPDAANKLKCVSLSNDTVSGSVSDMAINVCEQLVLKIKESDYFALPMDRSTLMC